MAKRENKMIEVRVKFWTNAREDDATEWKTMKATGYGAGLVTLPRNDLHDIGPASPVHFHTMGQILPAIEEILARAGVRIVNSREESFFRVGGATAEIELVEAT